MRETGMYGAVQGIGSLNRAHVLSHHLPESYISNKLVRCETLASVLNRHRVSHLDVFHVDAETYDYRIIQQIDFARFRPKLILYEHAFLGDDAKAARSFLSGKGYLLAQCGVLDTMAVRRD